MVSVELRRPRKQMGLIMIMGRCVACHFGMICGCTDETVVLCGNRPIPPSPLLSRCKTGGRSLYETLPEEQNNVHTSAIMYACMTCSNTLMRSCDQSILHCMVYHSVLGSNSGPVTSFDSSCRVASGWAVLLSLISAATWQMIPAHMVSAS